MINVPPARVAAALEPLRSLEPEVVLAVDERTDPAFDDGYCLIADRVLRTPFPGTFAAAFGWLRTHCGGDWILQIDSDEVPSPDLAAAAAAVMADDDATHAFVPRRWLYPDGDHYLAQWPWRPDYHLRLLRNDPALLRFPSIAHEPVRVIGPNRHLTEPLYHAHLLEPEEQRVRTVERYDGLRPDLRMEGRSLSEAYYLPERRTAVKTVRLPHRDRRVVHRWLTAEGTVASRGRDPAPLLHVDPDAVAAHQERSELLATAYRAELRLLDDDNVMVAGHHRSFDVEVHNRGDARWPGGLEAHPRVRLSYRWRDLGNGHVFVEGHRTGFGTPIGPGERRLVPATVLAPTIPGSYDVDFDLIHEDHRWFGCLLPVRVEVVASR
jgi:hypothetical protein